MGSGMSVSNDQFAQSMLSTVNSSERALRQRTLKKGIIVYGDGAITVECLVRDLSPGGAKLKLINDNPVPNSFELTVPQDGVQAECEVRWREREQIGVAFVGDVQITEQKRRQVVSPTYSQLRKRKLN